MKLRNCFLSCLMFASIAVSSAASTPVEELFTSSNITEWKGKLSPEYRSSVLFDAEKHQVYGGFTSEVQQGGRKRQDIPVRFP